MQSGLKNSYDCVRAIAETDFTEDLGRFDVPILLIHREDDHVVPFQGKSVKSAQLIKNAKDIYYPGAPHGFVTATHLDQVNSHRSLPRPDRLLHPSWGLLTSQAAPTSRCLNPTNPRATRPMAAEWPKVVEEWHRRKDGLIEETARRHRRGETEVS